MPGVSGQGGNTGEGFGGVAGRRGRMGTGDRAGTALPLLEGAPLSLSLGSPHPIPSQNLPPARRPPRSREGLGVPALHPRARPVSAGSSASLGVPPELLHPSAGRAPSVGRRGEGREEPAGPRSRSGDIQAGGETEPSGAGDSHRDTGRRHPAAPRPAARKGPEGHGAGQGWERQRGVGRKVLGHPRSPGS